MREGETVSSNTVEDLWVESYRLVSHSRDFNFDLV